MARSAGIPGSAVALGTVGIFLLYTGVKDIPVIEGLRLIVRGKSPDEAARSEGGFTPFEAKSPDSGGGGGTSLMNRVDSMLAAGGSTSPADMRTIPGTSIKVYKGIANNVSALIVAARAAGHNLNGWGFRSSAQQAQLRRQNCPDPVNSPSSACSPPTAKVGSSRHERGLAIDFTVGGRTVRSSDAAFRWLKANAGNFGLKNLPSEPWHWSTDGS